MAASSPGDLPHEDDGLAGLYAAAEEGSEFRVRSVHLFADPKMRELKHYAKSHTHEQRLRANASLSRRKGTTAAQQTAAEALAAEAMALRTDGCENVNLRLKRLAAEKEAMRPKRESPTSRVHSPQAESVDGDAPESREAMLRRMSQFDTRLQWRDHMDQSLSRLMADIEFARDDRLKEYSHKARCGHLDKIYDWYLTHGMKEARKERAAPPYVRFSVDGPVMPGSMRVAPKTREGAASTTGTPLAAHRSNLGRDLLDGGHGHSVSLPSLALASHSAPRLGLPLKQ